MKSPLLTPSIRSCPELPPELWELVAAYLSREDLWPLRSLNKAVFFIAVQVFYESLWISSYRQKGITSSTKDVCQSVIRESAFAIRVRRLHVHSDLKIGSLNRPTDRLVHLVTKALSSPHLKNVDHLSIHCDNVVLPYTVAVWNRFAKDLVTLELQFYSRSVCEALASLDKTANCPRLRSFIVMFGCSLSPPVFNTTTTMLLSSMEGLDFMNNIHASQLFDKLAFLIPAELEHLGLHNMYRWSDVITSHFLHVEAFPQLKRLHMTNMNLPCNWQLSRFLLARAPKLESLTLEETWSYHQLNKGGFSFLQAAQNLQELRLTAVIFRPHEVPKTDCTRPWRSKIQKCGQLRRLEIVSKDGWGLSGTDAFNLFVTLAKAGGLIQELRLVAEVLSLEHLLAALVLLPRLEQVNFVKVKGVDSRLRHLARGDGCTRDFKFVNLQRLSACLDLRGWRALGLEIWGNTTWAGVPSRRLGEGRGWNASLENALKKLGCEPSMWWEESGKSKDVLEVFARASVVA